MTENEYNALHQKWGSQTDVPGWREQLNEEEQRIVAKWDASLAKARAIIAAEKDCEGPAEERPEIDGAELSGGERYGAMEEVMRNIRLRYIRYDEYADLGATDEQTKEKYHFAMEQLSWVVDMIEKAMRKPAGDVERLKEIYAQVQTVTTSEAYRMLWEQGTTEKERRFWAAIGDINLYNREVPGNEGNPVE